MLRHQYVDLFKDLFDVRDAKWKKEEKNMNVSALFLFLPLYAQCTRHGFDQCFGSGFMKYGSGSNLREKCESRFEVMAIFTIF